MSQNQAPKEKKNIFSNYVVDGILLIIFGVIFLVRPKESLHFFLVVGGIILLIMGGVTLVMTIIAKKKQANATPNAYAGGNPNAYAGGNPNAYANANPNGQNAAGASKIGAIVLAVVQIVVGILLLAIPDFFANLFPYIAGAGIVIGALVSLISALKQKKRGNSPFAVPTIIVSLIGLALGIITICFAIGGSNVPMILIGIAMLADGVTLLLSLSKG
jgi:uncharacterized membrane protein HdeD (DUF308 family)